MNYYIGYSKNGKQVRKNWGSADLRPGHGVLESHNPLRLRDNGDCDRILDAAMGNSTVGGIFEQGNFSSCRNTEQARQIYNWDIAMLNAIINQLMV
jgi:hypothetical protein